MSSKRASARRPSKKQALNQKSSKNEPQHRIEVTLDAVLEKREMTLTALSEETGITMANLSILKTGKARGRFSTCCDLRGARLSARRHPPPQLRGNAHAQDRELLRDARA